MNKGMDVTDERIQTNIDKIKQLNAYTKKISNGSETKIIFTMKKWKLSKKWKFRVF